MRAEIETYARELGWILDQVAVSLDGLTTAQLSWRPATGSANSACAIASHVVGSTRVYALGFGCGRPVTRDRPAEFAASGSDAGELIAAVRQLAEEIRSTLATLPPAALDLRILPPRELWGTGQAHEVSGREALVEAIRHGGIHLGELRLTRELATRHA